MSEQFLLNVAGMTGVAPSNLVASVSDVFRTGITPDMAQKIISSSKDGVV